MTLIVHKFYPFEVIFGFRFKQTPFIQQSYSLFLLPHLFPLLLIPSLARFFSDSLLKNSIPSGMCFDPERKSEAQIALERRSLMTFVLFSSTDWKVAMRFLSILFPSLFPHSDTKLNLTFTLFLPSLCIFSLNFFSIYFFFTLFI